jgi:plastocyanin
MAQATSSGGRPRRRRSKPLGDQPFRSESRRGPEQSHVTTHFSPTAASGPPILQRVPDLTQLRTPLWNVRFGTSIIISVALLLAALVTRWSFMRLVVVVAIGLQVVFTAKGGIITLQDGLYGASCNQYSNILAFLAQYHDDGYILDDSFHSKDDIDSTGIALKDFVYPGSGKLWTTSLNAPETTVDWIVTAPGDLVSRRINTDSASFLKSFTPLMRDDSTRAVLFHNNARPLHLVRSLPGSVLANHNLLCGQAIANYPIVGSTPTTMPTPAPQPTLGVGDQVVTMPQNSGLTFSPAALAIKVGTTVTWTNTSQVPHTVFGSGIDSGLIPVGGSFSYTFATTGTFPYVCTFHPGMTGTITVVP